ncbi:MAG: hypothetical protein HGA37_01930 [Lentimicrobium sp.]|nr:hypothetical protein [Lentimicrobium sp.]
MKKIILLTVFLATVSFALLAQAPPNPPANAGSNGGPVGGNAPIGSGIVLLITLAAGYGAKKVLNVTDSNN